jgi:hypothetical protein
VKVTAANRAGAVHRGRGFLRLEAKALRNGDDVIGESFVPRSGSGVGRRGRRAVRGEEAVRGCFPDLLGCPLEREIAGGVGRRQDTNAAQNGVRHTVVLCRIAGEEIGRMDILERAAPVYVGFGHGTPLTRPRIGCSPMATPPGAAGTSRSPPGCRRSSNRTRCPGRRAG